MFYCSMTYIVDQLFPPIKPDEVAAVEFSHFNYWRDPIPEIDLTLVDSINTSTGSNTTLNGSIGSGGSITNDQSNTTLNGSHSKTLTTIPEN
ncbi:hypothetical protein CVS40_1920 [Lucilia cuprina]|nr:hypothetical protein CVS40_1920 [Lucilia cuprina]